MCLLRWRSSGPPTQLIVFTNSAETKPFTQLISKNKIKLNCAPAAGRRAPGFLELLLSAKVCVCVCVSAPEAINNLWCDIDPIRLVE